MEGGRMEHLTNTELMQKFGTAANYSVLGGMLGCSGLIGLYFWRKGQDSPEDTLLGGRSMSVIPITASIIASFMSALTLLGMPAEVYTQGTQFFAVVFTLPMISYLTGQVYIPVFHRLQIQSSYQYLELRFNHAVRVICGGFYSFAMMFYIAIVVYTPALALEQILGLDVDMSCATLFAVCVFYTSVGGMKAVVWTDVFQLLFMFLSTISILILATINAGGVSLVFDRNYQDGRIQFFNMELDPRERHTFWGTTLGNGVMWLSVFGVSQTQVQRYLSLPTITQAKRAVKYNFIITTCLLGMVAWLGMVLYATYTTCDPITAHQVRTKDQVLPLLVLHVAGDIPGLPGLFMAGVFSGSLSSVSSGLNSLAAIALKDFVSEQRLNKMSKMKQALLTKIFSALFGLLGYSITFLIRFMPGMLEAAMIIGGVINGPIIGAFSAGMLLPWVNSVGVLGGFLGSVLLCTWIATGGTVYRSYHPYHSRTAPPYPHSVEQCPTSWLVGTNNNTVVEESYLPGHIPLYDLSYIWYSSIGASMTIILAMFITIFTAQDLNKLDRRLLSPCLVRVVGWIPGGLGRRAREWLEEGDENTVQLHQINGKM